MKLVGGNEAFFRVTLGEESWDFDPSDLTIGQLKSIEAETGQSPDEWIQAIQRWMPSALQVLVWWLQGRQTRPDAVDFRFGDIGIDVVEKAAKKAPLKADGKKSATAGSPS